MPLGVHNHVVESSVPLNPVQKNVNQRLTDVMHARVRNHQISISSSQGPC